jgi:hypothetical protein
MICIIWWYSLLENLYDLLEVSITVHEFIFQVVLKFTCIELKLKSKGGDGIEAKTHFLNARWPYKKSKATLAMVWHNNIFNEVIGARDSVTGLSERDAASHRQVRKKMIVLRTGIVSNSEGGSASGSGPECL